jgi:hypothetical protein
VPARIGEIDAERELRGMLSTETPAALVAQNIGRT